MTPLSLSSIRNRVARWNRRRLVLVLVGILVVLYALGGIFVYRKPDTSAAMRFASFLPYPAAFAGVHPIWAHEVFAQ